MDLTPKQRSALDELRQRISGSISEFYEKDEELIKWLIARKYDVAKAEAMIRKSMKWRREWNIDSLLDWTPPEVLTNYCPAGIAGLDKDGLPVCFVRSGSIDMKGLLQSVSRRDFYLYNVQVLEKAQRQLPKKSECKRKNPIFRLNIIIDMDNYSIEQSMWKPAMDSMRDLTKMHEENYPEILGKAFVINAPKIFSVFYAAMRPLLAEGTLKKMKIYGKTGWKEVLSETIDPDQFPVHYGGTMTDPDGNGKCLSKICWAGMVPECYYHRSKYKRDLSEYDSIIVPNGRKRVFEFVVDSCSSRLSWQIESEEFDIGFGIQFQNGAVNEVILPDQRVNSELCPEEGNIICEKEGVYTMTLSNEFSLFRSKTVYCKFRFEKLSEFANNSVG